MTKPGKKCLVFLMLIAVCITAVSIEYRTHLLSKFIDNVAYDNKNHYLMCDQLPSAEEVGRVVREHKDAVEHIIKEVRKRIDGSVITPVWGVNETGEEGNVQDGKNLIRFSWGEPYDPYPGCLGTGKGDIEISYGAHQSRVIIEKIIGGDTFFGIPYRLRNI